MAKRRCGLDIGSSYLKAATSDGSIITSTQCVALPDNLVVDGQVVAPNTFSDILKGERFGAKDAALVLHSPLCHVRRTTMPAMGVKELALNLPYEFQDRIEEGKEKYRFDYAMLQMNEDEDGTPVEMDLLAAVTREDTIKNCEHMLRAGGLHLKAAAPDVCAYMNIIAASPDPTQDFCFLEIGSSSTRVYLFPKGRYEVTRLIEFGANSVARAVADEFGVEFALAKKYLETDYEGCQHSASALQAYEQLTVEVERIVNFFNFTYRDSDLHAIYFGGVGSAIEGLSQALVSALTVAALSVASLIPHSPSVQEQELMKVPAAAGILMDQGR